MAKVVFRQAAIEDLNEIWEYTVDEWSEKQADEYYARLHFACIQIGENPYLGKEYSEIRSKLFGLKSGKHIIFYFVPNDQEIEIIRILHARMDLKIRLNQ